jgi:hypothetical protein
MDDDEREATLESARSQFSLIISRCAHSLQATGSSDLQVALLGYPMVASYSGLIPTFENALSFLIQLNFLDMRRSVLVTELPTTSATESAGSLSATGRVSAAATISDAEAQGSDLARACANVGLPNSRRYASTRMLSLLERNWTIGDLVGSEPSQSPATSLQVRPCPHPDAARDFSELHGVVPDWIPDPCSCEWAVLPVVDGLAPLIVRALRTGCESTRTGAVLPSLERASAPNTPQPRPGTRILPSSFFPGETSPAIATSGGTESASEEDIDDFAAVQAKKEESQT